MSLVLRCISIPMLQIFQIALNNCLGLSFVFLVPSPYLKGQKDTGVAFSVNLYYARSSPQVLTVWYLFRGNIGRCGRNTAVWSDIRLVLKPWLLEWEKSPSDMCIQITAFGESRERLKKKMAHPLSVSLSGEHLSHRGEYLEAVHISGPSLDSERATWQPT